MGRSKSNQGFTQVNSLVTPQELRENQLFGIDIIDNNGNELPDSVLQRHINYAVSMLEHYLDMSIMPRKEVEEKDYRMNDYFEWGYLQLNCYPVISVERMVLSYLKEEVDGEVVDIDVQEIPKVWIRLEKHSGIIRLVPNNRFPARLQVDSFGSFFPELFRRHGMVPDLWRLEYTHGFKAGCIPVLINETVAYLAAIQSLNIAGDLIIGAGIASESISLDGLSQSVNTTSSAENHGYSAKVKEYQGILFGTTKDDPRALLTVLKNYYKGGNLQIV